MRSTSDTRHRLWIDKALRYGNLLNPLDLARGCKIIMWVVVCFAHLPEHHSKQILKNIYKTTLASIRRRKIIRWRYMFAEHSSDLLQTLGLDQFTEVVQVGQVDVFVVNVKVHFSVAETF